MNFKDLNSIFKNFEPFLQNHNILFKASVLIPIIEKNNSLHILFQKRSHLLNVQPGEISFPGGGFEISDSSFKETALRETFEEIGIPKEDIDIISQLDIMTQANIIIIPFLGKIKTLDKLKLNKYEVEEIFTIPIDFFIENEPKSFKCDLKMCFPQNFPFEKIPNGKNYSFSPLKRFIYFYEYENHVIWGITAQILKNFIDTINYQKLGD